MCAAVDLCSSRHCNICLLLVTERGTESDAQQLHKCNGCKLVYYCGPEHQRQEWPLHRAFCQAANRIMKTYKIAHPHMLVGQPRTGAELQRAIPLLKCLLSRKLARKLEWHEEELTSFPAHCAICFSFEKLKHCVNCGGVSYCTQAHRDEHAQAHAQHCSLLQLYYCAYKVHVVPTEVTYTLIDLKQGVPELSSIDLVGALEHATNQRLPAIPTATPATYQRFAAAADYSCMTTICYALTCMDVNLSQRAVFTIFIVGAAMEQQLYFQAQHVRFFFLQHVNITHLHLYFIGPELDALSVCQYTCNSEVNGVQRHVAYSAHRMLLQDFNVQCQVQPTMVVAFNCGFAEHVQYDDKEMNSETPNVLDTWRAGISELLAYENTPIVFTSYTKHEAESDLVALKRVADDMSSVCVECILNVRQNPYHDLRPLRNWQLISGSKVEEPIYYRNGWVQAVRAVRMPETNSNRVSQ